MIQEAIARVLDGRDLSRGEARAVMDEIMRGEATPAQIGGFLVGLRATILVGLSGAGGQGPRGGAGP